MVRILRCSFLSVQLANQPLGHGLGVAESAKELLAAAVPVDEWKAIGTEGLVFADVGDGRHQRADNDLGVVLEKVDLEKG